MENENNPSEANTSAEGVTAEEANENVSNVSILDTINEATGRNYKSEEEAIKGIKETTSYVGKVGKYKDVISAIESANGGEQGAIEALKDLASKEEPTEKSEDNNANNALEEKILKLEEESFFNANSDLATHKELIGKLKKDGQTWAEAVEENKETLDQLKQLTSNQSSKSVIHSNDRTVVEGAEYNEAFKKASETGDWTEVLRQKGVKI